MSRLQRWLDIALGRERPDAVADSTEYLWDPADTRSFEALRRSGGSSDALARPRPRVERAAALMSEVGGSAYALEELAPAEEPPAMPWLRRRPAVLVLSFGVGALLALVVGTASGAFDSGPSEAEVEAAFESGFADGEAETLEAGSGDATTEE